MRLFDAVAADNINNDAIWGSPQDPSAMASSGGAAPTLFPAAPLSHVDTDASESVGARSLPPHYSPGYSGSAPSRVPEGGAAVMSGPGLFFRNPALRADQDAPTPALQSAALGGALGAAGAGARGFGAYGVPAALSSQRSTFDGGSPGCARRSIVSAAWLQPC